MNQAAEEARLRAAVYAALSFAFHYAPREEDLALFQRTAKAAARLGQGAVGASLERLVALARENKPVPTVREFNDLFMVPATKYVAPYESVFVDLPIEADGKVAARTCGPSTQAVVRFYQQIGLAIGSDYTELPDYIGLELACMEFLCLREAQSLADGDHVAADRCRSMQLRFVREHLDRWAKKLAEAIRGKAQTSFYMTLADTLEEWIRQEAGTACLAT